MKTDWCYLPKVLYAKYAVGRWKAQSPQKLNELPHAFQTDGWNELSLRGSSPDGSVIKLSIKLCWINGGVPITEISVYVKLPDGTVYKLPEPATSLWEKTDDTWIANGLKIQVLEPQLRLRILYNGLLTNVADNTTQHCTLNLIWTSASEAVKHPEDWSNTLAADALISILWNGGRWPDTSEKWDEGNWLQWGVLQGRFQSYNYGAIDKSVYLRTRGVRENSFSARGYKDLKRTLNLTMTAKDGTMVQIQGISYKEIVTQCLFGSVRFPDFTVASIADTDLEMSQFCDNPKGIPKVYTIQTSTKNHNIQLLMRFNEDCVKEITGMDQRYQVLYLTVVGSINGEPATGIVELGYEYTGPGKRLFVSRWPSLKWKTRADAGDVGYCVSLSLKAARCPDFVGGKGASLALLYKKQLAEDYRVPPGFCLTIYALEKHLELNPKLLSAIKDIEAASQDYDENVFKEKCNKAVELFAATKIEGELKEDILDHLKRLKEQAEVMELSSERFAVRSSAVGEDSESLSAAGQNETILGCVTDEEVLRGVQKCWGSMFAFTSAHYRRQNGQACRCGGAVVVQTLVAPRAAGVMFTRDPHRGDGSRLIITANYGLGESVVSGSVEPDTFIVSRKKDELKILKTELGSKTQRVTAVGSGVTTEDVSEQDRTVACLTESEVLKLAKLGVVQDELWGAGRDIEWAIAEGAIFLLQVRPITSLERWTEEELLHEHDTAIMADNELVTFANTGEVLPRSLTPLTYDLALTPIIENTDRIMGAANRFDSHMLVLHFRCGLMLYNTFYRTVPKKLDLNVRMADLSIHGRKVATQEIINTAIKRRPPSWTKKFKMILMAIKALFTSKWHLEDLIRCVKNFHIDKIEVDDPLTLLSALEETYSTMQLANHHIYVTMSSSTSQHIAMSIMLEGGSDFNEEQIFELNTLLRSGNNVSTEVPKTLARFAKTLEDSKRAEEFRAQDPKHAMQWLKDNLPELYRDVFLFLEEHGHRAVMEFDLSTKPWILVPEEMMLVLQNMRHTSEEINVTTTDDEIISSLKTPKKFITRKLLRWILPLCRRTVSHREGTKAYMIRAIHKIRLAALRLGNLLVQQWYLPHADLVFYFRVHELRRFIQTRDPVLLRKASQRYHYFPQWNKLRFHELYTGWVDPIPVTKPIITATDVTLKATPVCSGEVIARACVIKDLSEIGQLQQGDVLITHSTDIGWSPYFPLLTGIVTELGGLISHGAVIAREYGLPCIVGAVGATDVFNTGDTVRLSGNNGVLERVDDSR